MWLLLDTNRKSYIGSLTAPLVFILSDLEKGQIQGHSDLKGFHVCLLKELSWPCVIVKHQDMQEKVIHVYAESSSTIKFGLE